MYNEYEAPESVNPAGLAPAAKAATPFKPAGYRHIVALYVSGFLVALFAYVPRMFPQIRGDAVAALIAMVAFIGSMAVLVAFIFMLVALYRAWKLLQADGQAKTTPGKAIGFIFIPIFGLFWNFVAYLGWARSYNATVAKGGYGLKKVDAGWFLLFCLVPVAQFAIGIVHWLRIAAASAAAFADGFEASRWATIINAEFGGMDVLIVAALALGAVEIVAVCAMAANVVRGYNELGAAKAARATAEA